MWTSLGALVLLVTGTYWEEMDQGSKHLDIQCCQGLTHGL